MFRSLWAGDDESLHQALASVARGEQPPFAESRRRVGPMAEGVAHMRDLMRRSGPRAASDIWRAAPPMAATAWLSDLYHPLPPKWRVAAAAATIGAGVLLVAGMFAERRMRRS